ncbi:YdcF family protein [Photobacterium sanguinicancri]|uniref:YdcF family protein n=1 Tax=Photobacterium sanguinicancri TaxID=875932 RepID=UPI002480B87F|nr:YdcF family protein [Photobacterium sanguinicancri]
MFKKLCIVIFAAVSINVNATSGITLGNRLDNLNEMSIPNALIKAQIERGDFESLFSLYRGLNQEKANVEYLSQSINVDEVVNKLTSVQQQVMNEAYNTVKTNTGRVLPVDSNLVPSGLIILGATPKLGILESRLEQAYRLAMLYPDIPIIVSGKGRKAGEVEADYMHDYLVSKGLNSQRIYKEDVSEDTVGNAVFTYFRIEQEPALQNIKDWLIVTNNFHAMRALFNYQRVFPINMHIAVYLAPLLPEGMVNPEQDKILRDLVASEIRSDSNQQFLQLLKQAWFDTSSHSFEGKDISSQPCPILTEMLLHHELYKDKKEALTLSFQCVLRMSS